MNTKAEHLLTHRESVVKTLDKYTEAVLIKQYEKERIDYYYGGADSQISEYNGKADRNILNNRNKWDWIKYLKDNNKQKTPIRYGTNSNNWNQDFTTIEQFQSGVSLTAYFINDTDGYYIPLMDITYNDYIEWVRQNKLQTLIK